LDGERPVRIRAVMMVGNDSRPLGRYKDLATQRSLGKTKDASVWAYCRFIFGGPFMKAEWTYLPGRHDMTWVGKDWRLQTTWGPVGKGKRPFPQTTWVSSSSAFLQGGLILKYTYTPWPQVQSRLGQVGTRIPKSDRKKHNGDHHIQRLSPSFVNQSRQKMMTADVFDLSDLYSLLRLSKALPSDTFAMLRSFHEAGLANMEPA